MITPQTIINMIEHWLSTPVNGYFGQGYGADIKSMLLQELSSAKADELLVKLRRDIPLLNQLGDNDLSIQTNAVGHDALQVFLMVGNMPIFIGETIDTTMNQDFYDTRAQ